MSQFNLERLPEDFPSEIQVVLKEGIHQGRSQLYAPYEHGGKQFKLVVCRVREAQAGETWQICPFNSPNGHIVFCSEYRKVLTASGENPLIERTRWCVEHGYQVTISTRFPKSQGWTIEGALAHVSIKDSVVKIGLTQVWRTPHGGRRIPERHKDIEWRFPAGDIHWKEGRYGRYIGTAWRIDESSEIVFWEHPPEVR